MATKETAPEMSVQSICNLLAKTKLMAPDDVRTMFAKWRGESRENVTDLQRFRQWLVASRYVTEYQADRLFRGQTDHYFLNQYKLLDKIGVGRMAGVYKAVHQLGQIVAIKILPPSKSKDPNTFARFSREARIAQRLKHSNVVRTYQTGESGGLYYLVMEHLEGETLQDVLKRRGKLPPQEAVRLICHVLQGLQHVHEQGLVHRDLSPGNFMLVSRDRSSKPAPNSTAGCTVKILDIGLGKVVFDEDATEGGPQLTTDGAILGTPDYMAPEQARNAHGADIRSDLYSIGCVLYHCLSGQPPFSDKQMVRVMIRHATEKAAPLKKFNPGVPDGLQQVVDTLMAKDPAQRFATPEQALRALKPFLTGTQLSRPVESDEKMQEYLKWLAANTPQDETAAPAAAPAPYAQPAPAPPPPPMPAPAAYAPAPAPYAPAPAAYAPAPAPYAPEPVMDTTAAFVPSEPEAMTADVELVPAKAAEEGGFSSRDWMLLGVGGG